MGEQKKLVWIQLAQTGVFKGHPQGPFALTPQVFDSICRNFKRDGLPIPIDAEHASEMPPTSGDIPVKGAPAMGWIHGLDNRGNGGLWGQVEWLEPARTYIKEGRYKFISPAIRFKSKDRVTGEETGPRLSSAGMTNGPFLPDMKPLTASANGAPEPVYVMSLSIAEQAAVAHADEPETDPVAMSAMCYSDSEFMPQIKGALGLHELSDAMECSDRLGQLRAHLDSVGGDHTAKPAGVDLSKYLLPLRALANVPMTATWDDVFDAVQEMIDASIAQHVAEYHEGDDDADSAEMSAREFTEPVVLSSAAEPTQLTLTNSEPAVPPAEPETINEAASEPAPTEVTTMANAPVTASAPATQSAPSATEKHDLALLTLKLQSAESEVNRLSEENAQLLAWKAQREEQDLIAEVSVAYESHKDRMHLKPESKTSMLASLRANPEAFRALFPPAPLTQRHLLQTLAATERSATAERQVPRVQADTPPQNEPVRMSLRQLSRQIMAKEKLPLGIAQQKAARILAAQR